MLKMQTQLLSISVDQKQAQLSKEQKEFNKLVKQIEAKRSQLAAWQEIMPAYQRKYSGEFEPAFQQAQDLQVEFVHGLDRVYGLKGITAAERRKIAGLICGLAGEVAVERDDAELKALYTKYSGLNIDEEEAAIASDMKSLFEDMLGVELGDDIDMSSPEAFMKRAQERIQEQDEQEMSARQAQEESKAKRKKTSKQLAKEAKQLADEQQTSQSLRELYRKLASALHPDREPDLEERERKTVLMQKINQAYDQKNLLLLLELQLELEHIDQATINNISASRLKHYNKILKEQIVELQHEVHQAEDMFKMQFCIPPFDLVLPTNAMHYLALEIARMEQTSRAIKRDLMQLDEVKKVKILLKAIPKPSTRQMFDEFF